MSMGMANMGGGRSLKTGLTINYFLKNNFWNKISARKVRKMFITIILVISRISGQKERRGGLQVRG